MEILGFDYAALTAEFSRRYGKGEYHAGAVFRQVHRRGLLDAAALPEFKANPALAEKVNRDFSFSLPPVEGKRGDGTAYKFLLGLPGGQQSESVVIPMRQYKSLCISSQIGCKMGCDFCETAQMGFVRNLPAAEITAQVLTARFTLQEPVLNAVFMGMGEPLDNFEAVVTALRILSDPRGLAIPRSGITVSTVGHVEGLSRLGALVADPSPRGLSRLRLAVSLNAADDALRARLMPIGRLYPLAELRRALEAFPLPHKDDFIFVGYVLLPGVNDSAADARAVASFLRGLRTCVNLIPYNPRLDSPYARPEPAAVARFYHALMEAGQYCRIRGTKGQEAMAACGQLGNRALRRGRGQAAASP